MARERRHVSIAAALTLAATLAGCVGEEVVLASVVPNVGIRPPPPSGLSEPVVVEFEGRFTLSYYCQPARHAAIEDALYDQFAAEHAFDVPERTRYLNATLSWDARTGGAVEDLELELYDTAETFRGGSWADQPERVDLELTSADAGTWLAFVYVCQSVPTDYLLRVEMS